MTSFDIIFVLVKISTSYHNKAICRRFQTYCLRVLRGDFLFIFHKLGYIIKQTTKANNTYKTISTGI